MTNFRPRKGLENLERSYLAGRYGGLPYVSSMQRQTEDVADV
jgi:hypothetical protein